MTTFSLCAKGPTHGVWAFKTLQMKKHIANLITGLRMVFSTGLLFCPVPSTAFYALYLSAGFTDMIDGTVARLTHTESEFGAKLDTVADFVFVAVCLAKLLPILNLPVWQYAWIAGIAAIKVINVIFGYITKKKFIDVHSVMNKVTGGVLFVFPLTPSFVDPVFSVSAVCLVATIAAIQEGYFIRTGKGEEKDAWGNSI